MEIGDSSDSEQAKQIHGKKTHSLCELCAYKRNQSKKTLAPFAVKKTQKNET
ncbi:hypothetical protein D3C85_1606040 [compost metagenome]